MGVESELPVEVRVGRGSVCMETGEFYHYSPRLRHALYAREAGEADKMLTCVCADSYQTEVAKISQQATVYCMMMAHLQHPLEQRSEVLMVNCTSNELKRRIEHILRSCEMS